MTSTSDSGTEGKPIAMQKKCQNTELVSGDCSAWPCHLNGKYLKGERERITQRGEKQFVFGAA